jgi:hypothetical protein
MVEYLLRLTDLVGALTRTPGELATGNLLLRQELEIMTRPTRKRPPLGTPESSSAC